MSITKHNPRKLLLYFAACCVPSKSTTSFDDPIKYYVTKAGIKAHQVYHAKKKQLCYTSDVIKQMVSSKRQRMKDINIKHRAKPTLHGQYNENQVQILLFFEGSRTDQLREVKLSYCDSAY